MNKLVISHQDLLPLVEEALRMVTDYWGSVQDRRAYPVTSGAATRELFSRPWQESGLGAEVLRDFSVIAEHSRPSGGRFFAYVAGSGETVGALADLLASALNQNVTSWRSAPAAVTIEHVVVRWLAEAVGCEGFHGNLCGGGSLANMMALAMARESRASANESGVRSTCVVYASEQVHMSIPKAVSLLGLGRRNLRLVPVDDQFRMLPAALAAAIAEDRRAGRTPVAVVASAGTVNTGSIDPIHEIAGIARQEDVWLHVDGAYGALAALAQPEKFRGLAAADSLSLDAHKWLYQPLDCGCLLYRDQQAARATFSDSGDYVKVLNRDPTESFAFFDESIELSRRFRALKLWMSLQFHGRRAFREAIASDLRHARLLASEIEKSTDLELLAPVSLSAVCFRHSKKDNEAILNRIIARGRVYLSNAVINGQFALRACFVNHRTREEDVREIVSETIGAAAELP